MKGFSEYTCRHIPHAAILYGIGAAAMMSYFYEWSVALWVVCVYAAVNAVLALWALSWRYNDNRSTAASVVIVCLAVVGWGLYSTPMALVAALSATGLFTALLATGLFADTNYDAIFIANTATALTMLMWPFMIIGPIHASVADSDRYAEGNACHVS